MENNYKQIDYNGQTMKILQYLSESDSQFTERLEYIKKLEKKKMDYKKAIQLSKLWMCVKFKKCKYDDYTMESINI